MRNKPYHSEQSRRNNKIKIEKNIITIIINYHLKISNIRIFKIWEIDISQIVFITASIYIVAFGKKAKRSSNDF